MKKVKNSDNEPVTRGEFREAIEELQSHVDDVRADVRRLEAKVDRIERVLNLVLKTIQSVDGQMKEQRDIPDRVSRLERAVFRLQTERK